MCNRLSVLKVAVLSLVLLAGFGAWGCGSEENTPAKVTGDAGGHKGGPGRGAHARPATTVAVAPVIEGTIASRYTASATLQAQKQATVLARVNGVIESIQAEEGDYVDAGEPLLKIGDQEFQYRTQQAVSALESARAKYDRGRKLLDENVLSSEAFDDVRNAFEGAEANVGLAELNLSYCVVTAPFNGRVTQRLVDPGQTVSNGTQLFTIADFTPLLAKIHVPSKMFGKLKRDQPVDLILDSSGDHLAGRIILVSPIIDPQSGTIKLTVEVSSYPENTRAGDFVEVRVITESHDQAVLVPKGAVIDEKGEQFVFVATDTIAVRRVLEIGFTDEKHTEILSGVSVGEQIVIRGQRNLKDGQAIRIGEDVISQSESK